MTEDKVTKIVNEAIKKDHEKHLKENHNFIEELKDKILINRLKELNYQE